VFELLNDGFLMDKENPQEHSHKRNLNKRPKERPKHTIREELSLVERGRLKDLAMDLPYRSQTSKKEAK